jgi:hypothetical protein
MERSKGRSLLDYSLTSSPMPGTRPCPFCGGIGKVSGVVDDVEFTFQCHCSGGSEEAVRWLLRLPLEAPAGDDWII